MKCSAVSGVGVGFVTILLASCGGSSGSSGGGGASAPPPPPPIPSSANLVVTVSPDHGNEGHFFMIDASGSTDTKGGALTFEVSQISGPTAARQSHSSEAYNGKFGFIAPEVEADAELQFMVTARDSTNRPRSMDVTYNVSNFIRPDGPYMHVVEAYDMHRPLVLLEGTYHPIDSIVAMEADYTTPSGRKKLIALGDNSERPDYYAIDDANIIMDEYDSVDEVVPRALWFNMDPVTNLEFAVISKEGNAVYWVRDPERDYPRTYSIGEKIDIQKPCYVQMRLNTGQNFAWFGQVDHGLSVVEIDPIRPLGFTAEGFNWKIKSIAGEGRSLCFIFPTKLPSRYSQAFPQTNLDDLIAIDFKTNELVFLADDAGNDEIYEIVGTMPMETGAGHKLEIIDYDRGNPGEWPDVFLLLMSDGQPEGEHRIMVIEQDYTNDYEITQTSYSWEGVAPIGWVFADVVGSRALDIVILGEGEQNGVIFEDERDGMIINGVPVFKEPVYTDFGPGADSMVAADWNRQGVFNTGIVVSFPQEEVVRVFLYRE